MYDIQKQKRRLFRICTAEGAPVLDKITEGAVSTILRDNVSCKSTQSTYFYMREHVLYNIYLHDDVSCCCPFHSQVPVDAHDVRMLQAHHNLYMYIYIYIYTCVYTHTSI
jgi:hypothetical protein